MTVVRPPITGDAQQDSWMDQVTNLINSGFFTRDTFIVSQGTAGTQGARGSAGQDGFNTATLYLFQRQLNTLPDSPPPDLATDLIYDYENNILFEQGNREDAMGNPIIEWDGWTQFIPEDPNSEAQYIWVITTNIADRQETDIIPFTQWSRRTLLAVPTISYEMDTTGFDFIRADQLSVDAGVLVTRYVGEAATDITASLTADHVKWSKHSLRATENSPLTQPWVSNPDPPYEIGNIVTDTVTLTAAIEPLYTPSAVRTYEYVNLTGNNGTNSPSNDLTNWRLTDGSRIRQEDDQWTVNEGWTSGVNISVDNQEVIVQTEFRAQLRDDIAPVPTS